MQSPISQHRSIDVAESEFRKLLYEDELLKHNYRQWCRKEGFSERKGFIEYGHSFIDEEESRWDVLRDPDMMF